MAIGSQAAGKAALNKMIDVFGCIPAAPDGQSIDAFNPRLLADAIAAEVDRSRSYGWSKLTIHMDIPDAVKLMQFLKTART